MALREITVLPTATGPRDAELVDGARAGERWACEALFRRHAPRANGLAFRLLGRDEDVDDVVQDAFVQALSSLDQLREPNAFGGWLGSMVVGRVGKLIRRRKLLTRLGLRRREPPIDPDELVGRSCPADAAIELRAVYGVLESMPADARIALILRRVEGLTIDEVAALVGASAATVKRRVAQAERQLRRDHGDGDAVGPRSARRDATDETAERVRLGEGGER